MATKFTSMAQISEVKVSGKTVFEKVVGVDSEEGHNIVETDTLPEEYENVMLLWKDKYYGDVFRCWDDDPSDSTIYFGTAGDGFNQ